MTTPLDDMLDTDAPYMLSESEIEELNEICDGLDQVKHVSQIAQTALMIKPHAAESLARVIRAGIEALSDES